MAAPRTKVEILQFREDGLLGNLALITFRQTKWGKRNGEYRVDVWDYDDVCTPKRSNTKRGSATLSGALDEEGLKKLAGACLTLLGYTTMANEICGVYMKGGAHDERTNRKTARRGLKGRLTKREQTAGEEADMAAG